MPQDLVAQLQALIDKDKEARRVLVTLDGVGSGFGYTETELLKRTGLEVQRLREHLYLIQRYEALEVRCTQVGTAGPFDYFFRTRPNLKVSVTVTQQEQK